MFSKPLAFVLLALGCLTAAAGGAYVATRHNLSDASARTAGSPAALAAPVASQASTAAPRTVAETEAPVSRTKPDVATPAAAERSASRSGSRPSDAPRIVEKPKAAAAPAETVAAARPPARTVPMTNPGAPAPAPESTPPQAAPVPAPAPSKPAEAVKPIEEPQPEAPREPQFDELILPVASVIGLQVETGVSSDRARVEDRVDARVSRDVMAAGRVAIPAGSRLIGSVTTVERGSKIKDPARLGIRFHTLVLADGTQVQLHTDPVYRVGEDPTPGSTKKIGGAAIGGAIIGAILGGGKGAAIGGAAGAGAGSAAVMAGDRQPATLRPGEYLNVKLSSPATITVERREQ